MFKCDFGAQCKEAYVHSLEINSKSAKSKENYRNLVRKSKKTALKYSDEG